MIEWHSGDPRESINKRAKIIIHAGDRALLGQVETKNVYCIWTDHEFDHYKFIDADAQWPEHWRWTWEPK